MMIEFKNGSKIETIDSKKHKRGYIRGRRLTDKEYWLMIDNEIFQRKCRVDKVLKELGLINMKDDDYYEDDDYCYECGGYGDDYFINDDRELECYCPYCAMNPNRSDD